MQWLDVIDPVAHSIGAVNTVVVQADGSLVGRNTDAFGFIESLHQEHPTWRAATAPACVMGAGGAARAVLRALLDDGVPDIALVGMLARLHLVALRRGWRLRVRGASAALCELVDLAGLAVVLDLEPRGEPELGEQVGVEEVLQPDDPVA